jgi:hypothetical protein
MGLGLGCSSLVQRLPSMCEALGSIPAPKNKRQKKKMGLIHLFIHSSDI